MKKGQCESIIRNWPIVTEHGSRANEGHANLPMLIHLIYSITIRYQAPFRQRLSIQSSPDAIGAQTGQVLWQALVARIDRITYEVNRTVRVHYVHATSVTTSAAYIPPANDCPLPYSLDRSAESWY